MSAVLAEIEAGTTSLPELAVQTGLAPDLVRAVVDRLVRTGRVAPWRPPSSCAQTGCRDCSTSGCPFTSSRP